MQSKYNKAIKSLYTVRSAKSHDSESLRRDFEPLVANRPSRYCPRHVFSSKFRSSNQRKSIFSHLICLWNAMLCKTDTVRFSGENL